MLTARRKCCPDFLQQLSPHSQLLGICAGLITLALLSFTAHSTPLPQPGNTRIAIIIDDMGTRSTTGNALIHLPYPLTFSFLPYRPHTVQLANVAHDLGRQIMLHAPMENLGGAELGPGALTSEMGRMQLVLSLQRQLKSVPFVEGVNNHMGSALTQNSTAMHWFMEELSEYPLFFIDSRTIAETLASKVAGQYGIPTQERDVFLDHDLSEAAIESQFERLIQLSRIRGHALAIGHPHPQTYRVLSRLLPRLVDSGITLVSAGDLLTVAPDTPPSKKENLSPEPIELILTQSRLSEEIPSKD